MKICIYVILKGHNSALCLSIINNEITFILFSLLDVIGLIWRIKMICRKTFRNILFPGAQIILFPLQSKRVQPKLFELWISVSFGFDFQLLDHTHTCQQVKEKLLYVFDSF